MQGPEKSEPQPALPRRPYTPPQLRELGNLREVTRGGNIDNQGEGPGISL